MIILGLTGSIAMGKTHAAECFSRLGVPIFDADSVVHALYAEGGEAVSVIATIFPEAVNHNQVDRKKLSEIVMKDKEKLASLEAAIHPLVRKKEQLFITKAKEKNTPVIVLEVPLLFETGFDKRCDKVAVVSAPAFIQKRRILKREGMTKEKMDAILARQMPDRVKCQKADYVIHTGLHKGHTFRQIKNIVQELINGNTGNRT